MEEVFEIAARITIFRDGRLISSAPRSEVTTESAIRDMVGRELSAFFSKESARSQDVLISVSGLGRAGVFSDISFEIHRGEVFGFAGLVGARRTDVGLALFGIEPADAGEIRLEGQVRRIRSPEQAIALGIVYVPEDRRNHGLIMPMSLSANISLPTLKRYLAALGLIRRAEEQKMAESFRKQLSIRAQSVLVEASKLSGGNQQKVVLSKWLNAEPKLLILDEPTRGIDVGAKAEVHQIINELAQQGMAIMMISSDLPEVLAMIDRILVMREGRQMEILTRQEATQERVMSAAMGQQNSQGESACPRYRNTYVLSRSAYSAWCC